MDPLTTVVDVAWLEGALTRLKAPPSPAGMTALSDALSAFVLAMHPVEAYGATVSAICRAATSDEPALADAGQRLLFSAMAEPLGDSFEPRAARLYDALFAEVIEFCRRLPAAADVDACLTRAGIRDRADMLHRKVGTGIPGAALRAGAPIRKVLVLSRVTIGADVAVTGVVLQSLARLYPHAELCLIGSSAPDLVVAGTRARPIAHRYERRGTLARRLQSWVELVETCERELAGLDAEHALVVDPDSRLTQLGLLPLVGTNVPSAFFESRSYRAPGVDTISELTAHWMEATFGRGDGRAAAAPRVTSTAEDAAWADGVTRQVRRRAGARLVGVNLGVGGNPRKRVGGAFELELLRRLLGAGHTVVLDYGAPDEADAIAQLLFELRRDGHRAADVSAAAHDASDGVPPTLLTYRGGLGRFAALLACTDGYIGYDSAFQHIAAAQGVPVVDIFVNPPNDTFSRRWRPPAAPTVRAIEVTSSMDVADALQLVLAVVRDILA